MRDSIDVLEIGIKIAKKTIYGLFVAPHNFNCMFSWDMSAAYIWC